VDGGGGTAAVTSAILRRGRSICFFLVDRLVPCPRLGSCCWFVHPIPRGKGSSDAAWVLLGVEVRQEGGGQEVLGF
jgi:hypothetical protein